MELIYDIFAEADDFDVLTPPEDADAFWRPCRIEFRDSGSDGIAVLRVVICSPRGIQRHMVEGEMIFGRGLIIQDRYDFGRVMAAIDAWIASANIRTWEDWGRLAGSWGAFDDENLDLRTPQTLYWETQL